MEIPDDLQSKLLECPPEVIAYILHLHEVIESLEFRIKVLEIRLNLNRGNSGKNPPLMVMQKNPRGQPSQHMRLDPPVIGEQIAYLGHLILRHQDWSLLRETSPAPEINYTHLSLQVPFLKLHSCSPEC